MTKRRLTKLTVTKVRLIRRGCDWPPLFPIQPDSQTLLLSTLSSRINNSRERVHYASIFRYEVRMILRIIAISLISPRLTLSGFLFDCSRFDLLLLFSISRANRIKEQKDLLISISAEFTSFRVLENRDLSSLSLLSLLPRVFRAPSRNEKELSSRF